ncbi:hypothetical protein LSH36_489g01012 [Paralvinella palmiformis]|uniref:Uncharacterized protein n=1 Tax=Paralvinella palmiformis TaxID=53620 RepID=A0AAD9J8U2_9ANNE|nr:hypothetical protein LSH36_489g01012 [Paralvinella palmiformis]
MAQKNASQSDVERGKTTKNSTNPNHQPSNKYQDVVAKQLNVDIATVTNYLNDTGIEEIFRQMMGFLLALPELPYNPYPGFVRRFKSYMERFHMEQKSDEEITQLLVSKITPTKLAYIFHPNHYDSVWGLRNIVELTEPKSLKQLMWLFESLSLENKWAERRGGYSVLFRMDPEGVHYMIGEKQYALSFIQVSITGEDEGLSYFSEFPLVTLHEGVFLRQSDAESYLATFTPKVDLTNVDAESQSGKKRKSKQKKKPIAKVRLDGFVLGDRSGYTPEAREITAPIMSSWQRMIARLDPQTELFDIIHNLVLLIQMDRNAYDDRLMIEIYRILHGTAARVHTLMQLNQTIRKIIYKIQELNQEKVSELVINLFMQYKIGLIELFDSPLPQTGIRDTPHTPGPSVNPPEQLINYKHGVEDERILEHDNQGLKTAMTLLDQATFLKLAPIAEGFIQKEFKMRQGHYRIAICCAVSGFSTLFGKIDPYLRQLELHEHCYARGPEGVGQKQWKSTQK